MSATVGDWVQVWGQVVDARCHPEDVAVEFFSHSDQFTAAIRADRVEAAVTPAWVRQCTHMRRSSATGTYSRCELHEGHGGRHEGPHGHEWTSKKSDGYLEEA